MIDDMHLDTLRLYESIKQLIITHLFYSWLI